MKRFGFLINCFLKVGALVRFDLFYTKRKESWLIDIAHPPIVEHGPCYCSPEKYIGVLHFAE